MKITGPTSGKCLNDDFRKETLDLIISCFSRNTQIQDVPRNSFLGEKGDGGLKGGWGIIMIS